ncbi:hypothetical protein DPEC_G00122490 [Dallia pectoralis]|uniref:Uncharacterized protein n=1 Tax=Dallia pectoralis TaxID=75939 RepID=A0ACC2GQ72_DALPE|nr:hypothetical protein DPEC_G00122490 [Dallia pectoralis]
MRLHGHRWTRPRAAAELQAQFVQLRNYWGVTAHNDVPLADTALCHYARAVGGTKGVKKVRARHYPSASVRRDTVESEHACLVPAGGESDVCPVVGGNNYAGARYRRRPVRASEQGVKSGEFVPAQRTHTLGE